MTPAIHLREEWWDLEIVEDSLVSAAASGKSRPSRSGSGRGRSATSSKKTRSTNSSYRRSGLIRNETQLFEVDQYARSVITSRSRIGPISLKSRKSVLKSVVQTAKQEWNSRTCETR